MVINEHIFLQSITSGKTASLSPVRSIYESAFPADERRNFDSLVKLAETNPDFTFYSVMRDNEPIGLFTCWKMDGFAYIEHFAISDKYRGWGIGQQIIELWLSGQSLPVIIEVEKPQDDISRRRIGFYERIGFRLWSVDYLQPAYSADKKPVPMYLMTYGNIDLEKLLDDVRQQLYRKVYGTDPVQDQ